MIGSRSQDMSSVGTVGIVRTAQGLRVSALGTFAFGLYNIPFFAAYSLFIYIYCMAHISESLYH